MRRLPLFRAVAATLAAGMILAVASAQTASAGSTDATAVPTVVLVHGAWEPASSWVAVAAGLRDHGYPVVVADNPLRTLAGDAASIASILKPVAGPTVLVGHSYGGNVITEAAAGNPNVKALVYIAAFAPDLGESAFGLDLRAPGSLLPATLVPVPFAPAGGGLGLDLSINRLLFRAALAADVAAPAAAAMAVAQRPVTLAALMGQAATPTWKTIPSWYLVARQDRAIPAATQRFMARRARADTVEIDSSHAAQVSHPDDVTNLILTAAAAATAAPRPPAVRPAIAGLRVSPSTFRVRPRAARVSYALDVPASVRLAVERSARGRTVGGRCVKRTTGNRGRPGCTRFVALPGRVLRSRPAGADDFAFDGRAAGRALHPGRYRLVATASADGHIGRPARARFRIVR
jgi:pimeloyl-ACP methyl ester carboxylesterase